MAGKKEKKSHMDLPTRLIRTTGNKKINNDKFLEYISKLFTAVDNLRFSNSSQGSVKIADDGALEIDLNLIQTQYQGDYREDQIVTIGADREEADYPFEDVINYTYTKDGENHQGYDHWLEADSIPGVQPFQYVYYKFTLLDEPNGEGDLVESELIADDDFPEPSEEHKVKYVVIGRTGSAGVWHQFHRGEIILDFTLGGGGGAASLWIKLTSGTVGSLVGDVYDNEAGTGTPLAIGVTVTAPKLTRGTLPLNFTFIAEEITPTSYNIYPGSIY